jgi:hypothetical protein
VQKLITKAQAMKLVGRDEVARIVTQQDTSLLSTGAKLFATTVGCRQRFAIGGYSCDGSDVHNVLAAIA